MRAAPKTVWNTQQIIIITTFKLHFHYALQLIELQTSAKAIALGKMPMFECADVWMGRSNMAIGMGIAAEYVWLYAPE